MEIKLICTDCKTPFSCEKGHEMDNGNHCPNCGSTNITIPTIFDEKGVCHFVELKQKKLF